MRNCLTQSVICSDPSELGDFLEDKKIEVTSVDELNDQTVLINYVPRKEWIEENECSNVGRWQ